MIFLFIFWSHKSTHSPTFGTRFTLQSFLPTSDASAVKKGFPLQSRLEARVARFPNGAV